MCAKGTGLVWLEWGDEGARPLPLCCCGGCSDSRPNGDTEREPKPPAAELDGAPKDACRPWRLGEECEEDAEASRSSERWPKLPPLAPPLPFPVGDMRFPCCG